MQVSLEEKKQIMRIALFAADILVRNGAEMYRVEDTIKRICLSKGLNTVTASATPTMIIIGDSRLDGLTFISSIRKRGSNMDKICKINEFSRNFINKPFDFEKSLSELKAIELNEVYTGFKQMIAAGVASAIFNLLFQGSLIDMPFTFFISIIGMKIEMKIEALSETSFLANQTATFIMTLIASVFTRFFLNLNFDSIIVGSIYPILPGVALTNGIRDFIAGDLTSGLARGMEAMMTAIAIATGVAGAIFIRMKLGI